MCLLILLCEYLGKEKVLCAHFNHKLRGDEADRDENFTRNIAAKLGVEFVCASGDVRKYADENKLGTEEAARKLRYDFLRKIAAKTGSGTLIATGHNVGDRIETMLFNMTRGSSIDGLKGIEYKTKDGIIRPLLDISKAETEEVCAYHGIVPVFDSTNSDTIYTRNRIRREVLPYLKNAFGSSLEDRLLHLSQSAAIDSDYLNKQAELAFRECCHAQELPFKRIVLDTKKYITLHPSLKRRLIRYIMSKIQDVNQNPVFPDYTGIYANMIESACELADTIKTGKRLDLPLGLKCIALPEGLAFMHESCLISGQKRIFESTMLRISRKESEAAEIEYIMKNKKENMEIFDADKIYSVFGSACEIEFRAGMPGDHFTPFGACGGKSLNKFYIDRKISRCERPYIRVAAIGNEIIWVPGIRRSASAPIDKNTTRVIILECISNTEVNG